jgi:hypothetical protein
MPNPLQRLIADRYGVGYNTNYLSEKLRKSGWGVRQPVRVAREREKALVTRRLQEHWRRIKKGQAAPSTDCLC